MTGGQRVNVFQGSNNMVSGDDSAKKSTQSSLIEESNINKESVKQSRSRYDQFISSIDVADFAIVAMMRCYDFSSLAVSYAALDFDPGLMLS